MGESSRQTLEIRSNVPTSSLTTLGVGGPCRWYAEVHDIEEFQQVSGDGRHAGLPSLTIGEGSNLLFSDAGFEGLLIRNRISGKERAGNEVQVGSGENLSDTIRWLNRQSLSGMENMFGIPGTVAGALVGNAGAYGQEIGDVITEVDVWRDGELKTLSKSDLALRYRHTLFKDHPDWFVVSCRLKLRSSPADLERVSEEILARRLLKYPKGLKCPGSFFKNVRTRELSADVLSDLPEDFVVADKVPAGKLLAAVGARGRVRGDAQFADYHGNLMINRGHAGSQEILSLAGEYAGRVWERFRIRLEPEVLIVDDRDWPHWVSEG